MIGFSRGLSESRVEQRGTKQGPSCGPRAADWRGALGSVENGFQLFKPVVEVRRTQSWTKREEMNE